MTRNDNGYIFIIDSWSSCLQLIEARHMPRFDQTGPWGCGPMTGRGLGPCGWGYRFRRPWLPQDEAAALEDEEKVLTEELEAVRQRRKELKGQK